MKQRLNSDIIFLYFAVLITVIVLAIHVYVYYRIQVLTDKTIVALNSVKVDSKGGQENILNYKNDIDKWFRLSDFFVSPDKVVIFIEALENLGLETGSKVTITSIDADKLDEHTPGKIGALHAKVSAIGSWSSVMHTLSLAEVMPYNTSINNVRIDRYSSDINTKKQSPVNEWKLSFDMEVAMVSSTTSSR